MIVNGVLAVAFVVLVGGVSFAAGRATAPVTTGSGGGDGLVDGGFRPGLGDGGFGQFPGGPNGADDDARLGPGSAGMSIRGTVKAVAGESLTLELADGRTIEIARDSGTDYHRQAEATASDLAAGETVIVRMDGGRGVGPRPAASDITIIP